MGSRKPSAKRKQVERFKDSLNDYGDIFAREDARAQRAAAERDAGLRIKACESKNRYAHLDDAEEALEWCVQRGRSNLRIYECPYCGGWHLTSKPPQ